MDMHAVVHWIQATRVSQQLADWATWLSPLCEIVHFLGLSLLLGAAGVLDLRLMGFLKAVPMAAAMEFIPWAAAGLAMNLMSGLLFIGIDPSLYLTSATFGAKVFFIGVAIVNVTVFEKGGMSARARALPAGADTTRGMKLVGVASLAAWFMVLFFGRMLPYLGSAY